MNSRPLKSQWLLFARKIAEGHSATDAYLLAGYHAASRATAYRAASRLRAHPRVQAHIASLRQEAEQTAHADTIISLQEKLAVLARIIRSSAADLSASDPIIQSHRTYRDGTTAVRIPCKLRAILIHTQLTSQIQPTAQTTNLLQQLIDQIRTGRPLLPEMRRPTSTKSPQTNRNQSRSRTTSTHPPTANTSPEKPKNPLPDSTISPPPIPPSPLSPWPDDPTLFSLFPRLKVVR